MVYHNNTHFTPTQCASHAIFLKHMDQPGAFVLWINLLCNVLPYTFFLSWLCAVLARSSNPHSPSSSPSITRTTTTSTTTTTIDPPRPFFGPTEKWFSACTVFLGINISLFLLTLLALQAQMYCAGGPISQASYGVQWIAQVFVVGGTVATAGLSWWSSLRAVRGKVEQEEEGEGGKSGRWVGIWWVFKWEAYVLVSPVILLAVGVVLLVKGPKACGQLGIVKKLRGWAEQGSWRRGRAKRKWWGTKMGDVSVDARKTPDSAATTAGGAAAAAAGNDLERGCPSWSSPLGVSQKVDWPLRSPPATVLPPPSAVAPPPPYTPDDPLA